MNQLIHTLERYKNETTDRHTSLINMLQQKQEHTLSHKTAFYIEGTNELDNYDVERKKIQTIGYKKWKTKFSESAVIEKKTGHGELKKSK